MKQKFTFLIAALMLLVFMMPSLAGWGQTRGDVTTTITINSFTDLPTGNASYSTYNWTEDGISGKATIYANTSSTSMQFNASNYLFYSTTAVSGKIKSVKLTTASGTNRTYEVYGSTTAYTGSGTSYGTQIGSQTVTTSGTTYTVSSAEYTYFTVVKTGSGAGYLSSVEVTYETSGGGGSTTVAAPEISPASCTFTTTQEVTITPASGTTVYYTIDGSDPDNTKTLYSTPFSVSTTTTVRAIAYDDDDATQYSDVVEATYTKLTTIASITAAGTYAVKGTVVAKSQYGMVVGDGTGYIYYANGYVSPSNNIGDVIIISGSVTANGPSSSYAKLLQFTNTTSSITEATGSGYNGTPAVTTITNALPYYSEGSHLSDYYQFTGTLTCDANSYYNIQVGDNQITIANPLATTQQPALNELLGESVTVKGYFAGINNSYKFTVMMGSVELYSDPSAPEYEWVATAISDLTPDDIFVIVGTTSGGSTCALPSTKASSSPSAVAVTVEDGAITSNVTPNLKWRITTSSSTYQFNQNGSATNYLYCTGSSTGVRVGSGSDKDFTIHDGYLKNTAKSRYIGIYLESGTPKDWRCYESTNGNIAGQTFTFYRRQLKTNDPTITVSPGSITDFNYIVGDGPSAVKSFTVGGKNLSTTAISIALESSNFELSFDENAATWQNSLTTDVPTDGTVANTMVYVRMKANLEEGSYSGSISVTCGNLSETVSLSGIVNPLPVTYTYTAATSITPGKRYIIVGFEDDNTYAMGEQKSSNRGNVDVTSYYNSSDDVFSIPGNVNIYEFVISGNGISDYYFTFYDLTNSKYLYASSSSANELKTQATNSDNGQWTITFTQDEKATITAQGSNSRKLMRFNPNNGSPVFACYATNSTTGSLPYLYEKVYNNCDIYSATNIDSDMTIAGDMNIHAGVVTVKTLTDLTVVGTLTNTTAANLVIEDGGQLYTESANVNATVHKTIAAWNTGSTDGWYFIASPINVNNLAPTNVTNMISDENVANDDRTYDLYSLDNITWHNYRAKTFNLANGRGYLYASEGGADLQFSGAIKAYDADYTISVSEGWNLIGNPYTFEAYPNKAYYTINDANSGITAQTSTSSAVVAPCTGIIIKAAEDGTVKFLKDAPETSTNNGNLQMVLAHKVATRDGASVNKNIDNAIVSFNEGSQLEKFYFGNPSASIFIPQNGEDYAIAFSDRQGDVPLYFKANETGTYTISFAGDEMSLNGIYLIDILAEEEIDLSVNPSYTFIGSPADRMARFKIVFRNTGGDGTSDIFAYQNGNDIIVSGEGELQIFDVMGRMVSRQRVNGVETVNAMPYGVYIFKLNGMTQKIVVR